MPTQNIKLTNLVKPNSMQAVLRETLQRLKEQDVDPKVEDEVEKAFTDAMNKAVTDFSAAAKEAEKKSEDEKAVEDALKKAPELEKIANECLRRRNKALVEGNIKEQQLNEEPLLLAVSIAIAVPRIVELVGKAVKFISLAMGGKGKIGDKLQHAGHKWHEKITNLILKGLTLIPGFKSLPADKQEKYAKVVHMVIVASLAVTSGAGAVEAVMQGKSALAGIEGALAAVKAGEVGIAKFLTSSLAKIMG